VSPEDVENVEVVHRELVEQALLEPLELDGADEQRWADCELALMAEHRLGDLTDPRGLEAARRSSWRERATSRRRLSAVDARGYRSCYWLLDRGQRVGILALTSSTLGTSSLRVESLYLYQEHRGHGIGRGALQEIRSQLRRRGLALRLETHWTWQAAARLYLDVGMWVSAWKRDLAFRWGSETPPPRVVVGERDAELLVTIGGEPCALYSAKRTGQQLVLCEKPAAREAGAGALRWDAMSTFSLALALSGWPLIRSRDDWARCSLSDGGAPEGLAYKITLWEAWSHKQGWLVDTPRIPGLHYPSWEELEAGWAGRSSTGQ
jgi:GNAT superfamily N-acetyltransferase